MPKIEVINSTTREGRFSEGVASWVMEKLQARGDMEVSLLDLREFEMPFFNSPSPAMNPGKYTNSGAEGFGKRITAADGFVILTAEYNRSFSGVLKNAIDHTWSEWNRKPVSFVGWGNSGGARAIESLEGVMVELEAAPLRSQVNVIGYSHDLLSTQEHKMQALGDQLLWWSNALKTARDAS